MTICLAGTRRTASAASATRHHASFDHLRRRLRTELWSSISVDASLCQRLVENRLRVNLTLVNTSPETFLNRRTYLTSFPSRDHVSTSHNTPSPTISELADQEYHQISDETLHHLTESLETLIESGHPKVEGWDVDYSCSTCGKSGVLTFSMGGNGTYVLNKQPPNKQIWFSSPFSGPKRFDYDRNLAEWFYSRDDSRLIDLIRDEVSNALGDDHFIKILATHKQSEE
ncbi:hypothetical protein CROQUDRAFT_658131 [Cronartium quercuum f. sp. fusiforme G11]|uniref:ferroxidase n=1 Tax=Cronartium quercuum f. sp. fusiforme G11 TaxID=708437 RepID=A0A9P6NKM0_9BASI|nr:hypothetical protein CROQUDRAFT_658131 [Cronartium quercuum f. sp. fusiforme G11]